MKFFKGKIFEPWENLQDELSNGITKETIVRIVDELSRKHKKDGPFNEHDVASMATTIIVVDDCQTLMQLDVVDVFLNEKGVLFKLKKPFNIRDILVKINQTTNPNKDRLAALVKFFSIEENEIQYHWAYEV